MVRRFLQWLFASAAPVVEAHAERPGRLFSTHFEAGIPKKADVKADLQRRLQAAAPRAVEAVTSGQDAGGTLATIKALDDPTIGDALYAWYASQGFIGFQLCALIAQHWLVDKACTMPARDAIRNGFEVKLTGETTPGHLAAITKANKRFRINRHMQEYVRMGRVFGLRIAIFKVETRDPKYYERPFNIDAVTPGSYKGIVQVDPYWCSPELDKAAAADPASEYFYEPTWWRINGVRYHRSHLAIFRPNEVPDLLKPAYMYGGVSVPQRIMERVYAAERTANEGPQLAMTKRTLVWNTDIGEVLGNEDKFLQHMANFVTLRDNYGVKVNDTDDQMQQFDTALADLDETIMTQYQLVAAIACVPATKLIGTTPKGFNSTGEYEEASYHEELETIQENDLTPLLERHLELVVRSEIEPKFSHSPGDLEPSLDWNPLDTATADEQATTNKTQAETDQILTAIGAIDAQDVRDRIRTEKDSGYFGIEEVPAASDAVEELDEAIADLQATAAGADPEQALEDATTALAGDPLERATAALQPDPLTAATRALENA